MNRVQLFEAWTPPSSPWSRWVKPALFAEMPDGPPPPPDLNLPEVRLRHDPATAVVIDLPGPDSVKTGLALLASGLQPVPLFNAAYHLAGVVEVTGIAAWLAHGPAVFSRMPVAEAAPPAFLLDAKRLRGGLKPSPGQFDNRWMTFPQDFPSANFLITRGIRRIVLVQDADIFAQPQEDLSHVLLRWQEAGLEIAGAKPPDLDEAQPLRVAKPSGFRALWQRALALAGLRRNSAGGFGAVVPQPSSGG